jgi:predicted acylesterase/phospholipase RssA
VFAHAAVKVARQVARDGGYFSTEHIRERLNYFLRTKLTRHHADAARQIIVPDRVRFKDIDPAVAPECCSLKVIVTDITNQKLVIFENSPEFQDVEVAEAVVASISIPFVFKSARINSYSAQQDSVYADGGLVSNLPIWVFTEEKLNFERAQMPNSRVAILGFSLTETLVPAPASVSNSPFEYVSGVARSAIFGGQMVATRFVADLVPVPMPIALGTTQFNFSVGEAIEEYNRAYAAAASILGRQIRIMPIQAKTILEEFHKQIIATIRHAHPDPLIEHLRVSIIQPFGDSSFRVVQSFNMASDADDRLVFSNLASGAPDAFKSRAPAYLDFNAMWLTGHTSHMTKYEFALLRKGLQSAICFPIFAELKAWQESNPAIRPQPLGVVSIDSETGLKHIFDDDKLLESLATLTLPLSAVLQP